MVLNKLIRKFIIVCFISSQFCLISKAELEKETVNFNSFVNESNSEVKNEKDKISKKIEKMVYKKKKKKTDKTKKIKVNEDSDMVKKSGAEGQITPEDLNWDSNKKSLDQNSQNLKKESESVLDNEN